MEINCGINKDTTSLFLSEIPDFNFEEHTLVFESNLSFILLPLDGKWYSEIFKETKNQENNNKGLSEYFQNEFSLNSMTFERIDYSAFYLIFQNIKGFKNAEKLKEKFTEMILISPPK